MSPSHADLRLHEEVVLLALRDDTGTVESRAGMHAYAIGGAILAELALAGRIRLVTEGKRTLVEAASPRPTGDPILDEALQKIAESGRRRQAADWVARLASLRRLRHRVADALCRKGILRGDEGRILLIFRRKLYPAIDPMPEKRLLGRMRVAIAGDSATLEPRTALVVALAHAARMLPAHFDRKFLRGRKKRLEAILAGDLTAGATRAAVVAAQVAVTAACMVAITAATATHAR